MLVTVVAPALRAGLVLPLALSGAPSIAPTAALSPALTALTPSLSLTPLSAALSLTAAPSVEEFDEEHSYAEKKQARREARLAAHAEREAFDFVRGRYSPEEAAAMAAELLDEPQDMPAVTGLDALRALTTELSGDPDLPPDPTRLDAARFGLSEEGVRAAAARFGTLPQVLHRFLDRAYRAGVIYRLHDLARGKTYYGVPPAVRLLLGLEPKQEPVAKSAVAEGSALADALTGLASRAEGLPKNDELFEFTAQAADAAVEAGVLAESALSAAFRRRADALGFELEPLNHALLTLLESADGTPFFDAALEIAELAVAAGRLTRAELDETLRSL